MKLSGHRFLSLLLLSANVEAQEVQNNCNPQSVATITASKDAFVYQQVPNAAWGDSDMLWLNYKPGSDRSDPSAEATHPLLHFDMSTSGIPTDATILNATLQLSVYDHFDENQTPRICILQSMTRDWNENQATWNRFQDAIDVSEQNFWATPGGDYFPFPIMGTGCDDLDGVGHMEISITTLGVVYDMLKHPSNNRGWIMQYAIDHETTGYSRTEFYSREADNDNDRPKLQITYNPCLPLEVSTKLPTKAPTSSPTTPFLTAVVTEAPTEETRAPTNDNKGAKGGDATASNAPFPDKKSTVMVLAISFFCTCFWL